MKPKPTITINPVAWDVKTGRTLKYQAVAELGAARIYSSPCATSNKAAASLLETCKAYAALSSAVAKLLTEKPKNKSK